MSENEQKEVKTTNKATTDGKKIAKKDGFANWFTDVEKLFAVFAAVICGYIALTIKNAEPFLTFVSRHSYINDMLHDHIFRDYLEIVNEYVPKAVPYLLLAVIVLLVASFIMDYEKSEHGYVLRIAGMLMASLIGLGYILVYVIFGFAEPVMNAKVYVFLSLIAVGFVLAIISCIYYGKKRAGARCVCRGFTACPWPPARRGQRPAEPSAWSCRCRGPARRRRWKPPPRRWGRGAGRRGK